MNTQELNNYLCSIRENCNNSNAIEMLQKLEEIFIIKPVSLLYFNVKAKVLCKLGRYEEAIKELEFKINLYYLEEEYIESCRILQEAYKITNNATNYRQYLFLEYYLKSILTKEEKCIKRIKELQEELVKIENIFLYEGNNEIELANSYWETYHTTEAIILYASVIKKYNINFNDYKYIEERIYSEVNYNFLLDELLEENNTFILLANKEDIKRCEVLAKSIRELNHKVSIINLLDSDDEKERENNIRKIGNQVLKKYNDNFSIVIGSSKLFNNVSDSINVKGYMQRLSEFKGEIFKDRFCFGYSGGYISYISKLYSMDVNQEIEKETKCKFSIVIPVRNSAESLRYTIKTCLEQRDFNDDYEIVISDNSEPEFMGVEEFINEINDNKIRYFRTPKPLNLCKSFEYAFLKTNGEFIISLGADDGLLPWALVTLKSVLDILPEDDVIQWERGFFVWPNNNSMLAQRGQFTIPKMYKKNKVEVGRYNSLTALLSIIEKSEYMYNLPMLYINSGFRRRYIKKLLNDTGRMWDSNSQDVYIGIVNLLINESIPIVYYPITIAGMTSQSIGNVTTMGAKASKEYVNMCFKNNVFYGNAATSENEFNFPWTSSDRGIVYTGVYRALGLTKTLKYDEILNKVNIKEVLEMVTTRLNISSLTTLHDIQVLRFSAYYQDDDLGKWFDDYILKKFNEPKSVNSITEKIYYQGLTDNGGLQLDASKFNVNTIYDAVKLFENICNL